MSPLAAELSGKANTQGRIQEIEFGGVQAVFAGADAGLGVRAHKPG